MKTKMTDLSSTSISTDASFDGKLKKGAILFTGPDGMRDQRVKVEDYHFIGHTTVSPEATADLNYLYRAAEVSTI